MSYFVVWGYKTGLSNKKFLGIKPCNNCGKFAERYLAKSFFRINLFWFIPIFGVPTGKYLRCGNCDGVRKLTRQEWAELKESARFMPKKKQYLHAYEELKSLVISADADDLQTDIIYNRLLGKLDFTDDGGHIRELVDVYLKNSQNAAAIAAKANPELTAETPALVTENGVTREVEAVADQASAPAVADQASAPAVADVQNAAPVIAATPTGRTERSKLRFLWLIPAIILLPIAAIFASAGLSVLFSDMSMSFTMEDLIASLIFALLFIGIPVGLDILFFVLAFKKYKN